MIMYSNIQKMNKKILFCGALLFGSSISQTTQSDNNLRGPGNVVFNNGKRNDVIGADNGIDGNDNRLRGN